MNEQRSSAGIQVLVMFLVALLGIGIFALWQIGRERVMTLGLIFVGGLTLALVLAASALPIRAWRRRDMTGESHHYHHDGTKTIMRERVIDGRAPAQADIKLLQLPAPQQGAVYPELLRAAYQAGRIAPQSTSFAPLAADPRAAYTEADLPELDFTGDDGWSGDIISPRP